MSGRFIGLGGRLTAGKDAVADHLVDQHGFVKVGMSDPLLAAALVVNPWIPVNAEQRSYEPGLRGHFVQLSHLIETIGYVEAKKNKTVRDLLQHLGTDVVRDMFGGDAWVDIHSRNIRALLEKGADVVLTGLRYPNEVEMTERIGGLAVWVERPNNPTPASAMTHASETSVWGEDFMVTINNTGTLEDLHRYTDQVLAEWSRPANRKATPCQKVLVDGAILADYAQVQPADHTKATIETFATGPIVVDRARIQPVV